MEEFVYGEEAYFITGICMEIHNILGWGLAEIVYKDALAYEFTVRAIDFEREKKYVINYKKITLPHFFYADLLL